MGGNLVFGRCQMARKETSVKRTAVLLVLVGMLCALSSVVRAQNWSLVIKDNALDTPVNQVNGVAGGTASLYATLFNFTGTPASDDGLGNPAPATTLDFAGFGFTLNPGQTDLEARFTPDPRVPGWPEVEGSIDGSTPGISGYVTLGSFDLTGLVPGTYEEDFTAGAFPMDPNSTVPFEDIHGTLVLNVAAPAAVPEPNSAKLLLSCIVASVLVGHSARRRAR